MPKKKKLTHPIFAAAPAPVDWTKPFEVESWFKLPTFNQDGSSSCTAQATCYYCMALMELDNKKFEEYSRRYIYSQTALPGGGAYIADAMGIPLQGAASESSVPEGDSSEATMKDASLNVHADIEAKAEKFAEIANQNIDNLASIVEQYGGFVTGFNGSNDMFDVKGVASIPQNTNWSHAVWVCGHQILPDGRKALKFKNSWSAAWGDGGYGYFPEGFPLFDAYVYADIKDTMFKLFTSDGKRVYAVLNGFRFWVFDPNAEINGQNKLWTLPPINDPSVLNLPYGGAIMVSNTDDLH